MAMALSIEHESWPLKQAFTIARGSKCNAELVVVEVSDGDRTGRGECTPYPRYGESLDSVIAQLKATRGFLAGGRCDRHALGALLPPGAARNALDCALWELEARHAGRPVWWCAELPEPEPRQTAVTISLDAPDAMALAALELSDVPLLKVKLGQPDQDAQRLRAVRAAAPVARLIVDANEGWSLEDLERLAPVCADVGVEMVEQPLPADADSMLIGRRLPVPLCADESCHVADDVDRLADRYQAINVKLDKAGGLTEAIALVEAARAAGLKVMVGCMVATSLSMAPAYLLAALADYVDLDGPVLLARDREPGFEYDQGMIRLPAGSVWG